MLPTALACAFLAAAPCQVAVGNPLLKPGPDDLPSRVFVDGVFVESPDGKDWKPCAYDGEVWVAPQGAERRPVRVTGVFEEAAGWKLNRGWTELAAIAWTDSPRGVGFGTYENLIELKDGRFTVELRPRTADDLAPYLDPFSADGPMVDVDLSVLQQGLLPGGGRHNALTLKMKVMVAYP